MLRSLLFVPVLSKRFLLKAPNTAADAIILDLEASIPADRKQAARDNLPNAVAGLKESGKIIASRINPRSDEDLSIALNAGIEHIIIPLVESVDDLTFLMEPTVCTNSDATPKYYPIIETPLGLINLTQILTSDISFGGVMCGVEDFIYRLGPLAVPEEDVLAPALWQVTIAAKAFSLQAYGIAESLANIKDQSRFRELCIKARNLGVSGCPAVHPDQVDIINEAFSPTAEQISESEQIIALFEEQGGNPFSYKGRMIDLPIILRHKEILKFKK